MAFDAERLKDARRTAGLTMQQLAEKVGVSQQMVSLWERGVNEPSPKAMHRLLEVLPDLRPLSAPYPPPPEFPVYGARDPGDLFSAIRGVLASSMTPEEKITMIEKLVEVKR